MRTSSTARAALLFLAIAVALGSWGCCKWCKPNCDECKETETPAQEPKFKVVLQHECVGAWAPFNNTFKDHDSKKLWHGVMAQLGTFDGLQEGFTQMVLTLSDGGEKLFGKGEFVWVNILPDGVVNRPMEFSDLSVLGPIDDQPDVCDPVVTCTENAKCYGDPADEELKKCFRQEKLHRDQHSVDAILTLWTKPADYDIKATAVVVDPVNHPSGIMSWDFRLTQGMRVEVWDKDGIMVYSAPAGQVTRVEVQKEGGGDHGGTHSPAWPR